MGIRRTNRIELLQGTLDMLVLEQLKWGPNHGYGIGQALREHSGEFLQVDAGSLYPALHRLERQKLVTATWETSERKQRTRVYRLTAAGRRHLTGARSRWEQMAAAIGSVLNRTGESES